MANIKSIGGNPIVLGLDGLTDDAKAALGSGAKLSATSESLLGADSTAQWAQRVTAGSGAATVRSVQGAAVGWNQLCDWFRATQTVNGVTFTNNGDGSVTLSGTATKDAYMTAEPQVINGHKYMFRGCPQGGSASTYYGYLTMRGFQPAVLDTGNGNFGTCNQDGDAQQIIYVESGTTCDNVTFWPQLFDLTKIFGSGNEPTTVAEFEAMYPLPYYPYSAPTLKPVRIAGIRSVGFNQWDEEWERGGYTSGTGAKNSHASQIRNANPIRVLPNTEYYARMGDETYTGSLIVFFYDAGANYLSNTTSGVRNGTFTTPADCHYINIMMGNNSSPCTTYNNDICINISNPALNGQYKPYTTDSVEWTAQTLRAAGSVRDELTAGELVTRVGVVDLGEFTWSYADGRFGTNAAIADATSRAGRSEVKCAPYTYAASGTTDKTVFMAGQLIYVYDSAYTDAAVFKAAMAGVLLYYELATPTTTPITPALPMTYRVERGGTESIIVPTGEISAAPVLTVAEGESAADVVMYALACIAAPDGPVATANHAINTYLTYNGKLYKVTSAIAVGETIVAGTNVTATTVMDEILALN